MQVFRGDFVRAFLPAVFLAFCEGCGGGAADEVVPQSASTPPPAAIPANTAPVIQASGTLSAQADIPYEYLPDARDADGDELRFSADNLPPWADLDPATGRISGTPRLSDLGTHEGIILYVADATHETASEPFAITVQGKSNGVARLAWQKPDVRVDGAPLEDLAGYRIVYGRNADDLDHSIFINDPEQLSYEFATLDEGVWYFAIIAVSTSGLEGPPTPPAMKTV